MSLTQGYDAPARTRVNRTGEPAGMSRILRFGHKRMQCCLLGIPEGVLYPRTEPRSAHTTAQ